MSEHRPITRSRSKKFNSHESPRDDIDPVFVPPPLNIRKATPTRTTPRPKRLDVASIGLAVGTPKDSPLPPLPIKGAGPPESSVFQHPSHTKPRDSADESRTPREGKQKGSRWKSLGTLFGKKESSSRTEAAPLANLPPLRPEWQAAQSKSTSSSRKRAGSDKEKATEEQFKATTGQMGRRPSLMRRASAKRKASQRRKPGQAKVERNRSNRNSMMLAANGVSRHLRQPQDYSLLQIEIPNVEMERYSVMFGNVLKGSPNASRTSLARPNRTRLMEATPEEHRPHAVRTASTESVPRGRALNAVENEDLVPPARPHQRDGSASSTGSHKAPSFSLFPSTSSSPNRGLSPVKNVANKPLPKPSPLSRSVTAPNEALALPRPSLKPTHSDSIAQPVPIAPGKENIPTSRWSHSRQGSAASAGHQEGRPASREHIVSQNVESYRPFHRRNPSLEPSTNALGHHPASSKFLDVSEFSSNNPNLDAQGPAVRPPTPPPSTVDSHARSRQDQHKKSTKQALIDQAFPARKSSLKRLPKSSEALPSYQHHQPSAPPAPQFSEILSPPSPPLPPYAHPHAHTESTDSISSITSGGATGLGIGPAEVSIARQISISRRQRQLLVPVVAKTARQPLQPHFVPGLESGDRKSELVMLDTDTVVGTPTPTREDFGYAVHGQGQRHGYGHGQGHGHELRQGMAF